jgi:hypothetical protein
MRLCDKFWNRMRVGRKEEKSGQRRRKRKRVCHFGERRYKEEMDRGDGEPTFLNETTALAQVTTVNYA